MGNEGKESIGKSHSKLKRSASSRVSHETTDEEEVGMDIDIGMVSEPIPRRNSSDIVVIPPSERHDAHGVTVQQKIDVGGPSGFKKFLCAARALTPELVSSMRFKEFPAEDVDEFEDIEDSAKDRLTFVDEDDNAPLLKMYCVVNELYVFPSSAISSRRSPHQHVDEYRVNVKISRHVDTALAGVVEKLKNCPVTPNIAVNAGLIQAEDKYREMLDTFEIKIRGLFNRNIEFLRKVAAENKWKHLDGDPKELQSYPKQETNQGKLRFSSNSLLSPMIPVLSDGHLLTENQDPDLPQRAYVYFEMVQGACNFYNKKLSRWIRQINVGLNLVAVELLGSYEPMKGRAAKRRRYSRVE